MLDSGKIIMPADNDWKLPKFSWIDTGAYLDGVNGIRISDAIEERGWIDAPFRDVAVKGRYDAPVILKQALLSPCNAIQRLTPDVVDLGHMWADSSKGFKAAARRGGYFSYTGNAGVFALSLSYAPSNANNYIGFRACKV
jgi:hypothetical protein